VPKAGKSSFLKQRIYDPGGQKKRKKTKMGDNEKRGGVWGGQEYSVSRLNAPFLKTKMQIEGGDVPKKEENKRIWGVRCSRNNINKRRMSPGQRSKIRGGRRKVNRGKT